MTEIVLVADIGGTHARFALADPGTGEVDRERTLRVREHATIADAARAYLKTAGARPTAACFAVAAPVGRDEIALTNSDWTLDRAKLRAALGLTQLRVINDFVALASGVHRLRSDDFAAVKPGLGEIGAPTIVLGPGTGFGQALIVPCGDRRRVVATEGGHVAFAPQTEDEFAVMRCIASAHGRVSVERFLSGGGLVNIHRALRQIAKITGPDLRAAEVTAAALAGADPIAVRAVEVFCAVLGEVAGDAVLATGANGGVVLGGGILPKIRDLLAKRAFIDRFLDKGRLRAFVEVAPVRLIMREGAALVGAAAAFADAPPD